MRPALRAHAAATLAVVERDARLFLSYRLRPLMLLVGPVTTVTLFYYVSRLLNPAALGSADGYFAYVVIGVVALGVLTAALGTTPVALRQELVAGTFERLVLSPFGAIRGLTAMMVFPVVQALFVATFTVIYAALVFGMEISWPDALLAGPAALLGAIAFAPFGLLTIAGVMLVKQALGGVSILLTAMSIFAGVYFPVALLPDALRWVSEVQPFTPALDLLRGLVSSAPTTSEPWLDVAKLVGFTLVLFPLSLWALARSLDISRRRGTIIEY